ncbi:MAG: hypothetical protein NDJ90_01335 [Oligoflexia bacterium]|nr:hypothetical protein [Oligoflexia bacterium]
MSHNARTVRKKLARQKVIRTIGLMTATLGMIVAAGILSLQATLQSFLERDLPRPESPGTPAAVTGPAQPLPPRESRLEKVDAGLRPGKFFTAPRTPFFKILNGQPVVSVAETRPDGLGNFTRVTIVKTQLKYPLIRVEDRLRSAPPEGSDEAAEQLLARTAMVADHLMLTPNPQVTEEDLTRLVASLNEEAGSSHYEIRRTNPNSRIFLIAFDGTSPQELEEVRARISATGLAREVEPDYLVHN